MVPTTTQSGCSHVGQSANASQPARQDAASDCEHGYPTRLGTARRGVGDEERALVRGDRQPVRVAAERQLGSDRVLPAGDEPAQSDRLHEALPARGRDRPHPGLPREPARGTGQGVPPSIPPSAEVDGDQGLVRQGREQVGVRAVADGRQAGEPRP